MHQVTILSLNDELVKRLVGNEIGRELNKLRMFSSCVSLYGIE